MNTKLFCLIQVFLNSKSKYFLFIGSANSVKFALKLRNNIILVAGFYFKFNFTTRYLETDLVSWEVT